MTIKVGISGAQVYIANTNANPVTKIYFAPVVSHQGSDQLDNLIKALKEARELLMGSTMWEVEI